MLRKLRSRLTYANVMSTIAVFVAVSTGGAYAANTVFSSDIVDGEVKSVDIANDDIQSGDIKDNSINTFDVHSFLGVDVVDGTLTGADIGDSSLTTADIQNFTLGNGDFLTGSVDSRVATDNSLTGTDINESTLNLPQTPTTATFAQGGPVTMTGNAFVKIASKNLQAGSWAIVATANTNIYNLSGNILPYEAVCELRNGTGFIGGATDRRLVPGSDRAKRTLSMNGGAQVPAGGGEVSLWCKSDGFQESVDSSQMMMTRLDGFS